MFTGIVDARGRIQEIRKKRTGMRLDVRVPAAYRRLKTGASVAVDGVCLTVVSRSKGCLGFDVIAETLRRSRLGGLQRQEEVNLERPLRWKGRVEGHLVQGHVDGVARVLQIKGRSFRLAYPKRFRKWIAEKGSVALNGVSLTVGRKTPGSFWVHVIPHTFKTTNLRDWKAGSRVNLEADLWLKARFR